MGGEAPVGFDQAVAGAVDVQGFGGVDEDVLNRRVVEKLLDQVIGEKRSEKLLARRLLRQRGVPLSVLPAEGFQRFGG